MDREFHIDFITHSEYEYLAVEISFRGQRICQLYRRKEDNIIEIQVLEDLRNLEPNVRLRFPLSDFLAVLQEARRELLALKL
jgi:hypothetical protein